MPAKKQTFFGATSNEASESERNEKEKRDRDKEAQLKKDKERKERDEAEQRRSQEENQRNMNRMTGAILGAALNSCDPAQGFVTGFMAGGLFP